MDESWRMQMGLNNLFQNRRRSTEETTSTTKHRIFDFGHNHNNYSSDSEDFSDVFGGPPRTALSRNVFRSSEPVKKGRDLPVFEIQPAKLAEVGRRRRGVYKKTDLEVGFFDDIFGSDEDRKSRLKSNCSSSVLSSEDLSPIRACSSSGEDVFFSSFSSKLRPIHIPLHRNLSSSMFEKHQNIQRKSDTPPRLQPPFTESHVLENKLTKNHKSSPFKLSRSGSSPETSTIEPYSYRSIKTFIEDIEIDSPSSVVSSLCDRDPENKSRFQDKALQEEEEEEEEDIMSSYVIEFNSEKMKRTENESVVAIDEAIAWAKEKFQSQSLEAIGGGGIGQQTVSSTATEPFTARQGSSFRHEPCNQQRDGHGRAQFLMVNEKLRIWMTEDKQQSEKDAGSM